MPSEGRADVDVKEEEQEEEEEEQQDFEEFVEVQDPIIDPVDITDTTPSMIQMRLADFALAGGEEFEERRVAGLHGDRAEPHEARPVVAA